MKCMQLFSPFCPSCRETLTRNGDSFTCTRCGKLFPLKGGIIDFLASLTLSDIQQSLQKEFDGLSPDYDNTIVRFVESLNCPWSLYTEKLEEFLNQAGGKVILDIGCGTAFPVGSLIPATSIYVGLDISFGMLSHAHSLVGNNVNMALWGIDVERIPLPAHCIDFCLALMVFNVFPDPRKAVEEIQRVLKENGEVFGTVPTQLPPSGGTVLGKTTTPRCIEEMFAPSDYFRWDLSFQSQGGILFFHLRRCEMTGS